MSIPIFCETVPVRTIDVTEDGPAFTYDPAWPSVRGAFPVSLRIPLAAEEGVSMSLAGTPEKLPVAMVDRRVAIPVNGAPSTHILKPDSRKLYGSVQNEALCLVLARRLGLRAAEAVTGIVGGRTCLLITRQDAG